MLDTEQKETHVVWDIPVPRQVDGRFQWPAAIKQKAVERILGGETDAPVPAAHSVSETASASCDLFIGDVRLAVTPGYPGEHLTKILRAVRASQ